MVATCFAGTLVRVAYAEGNALGKGPVLFQLPQESIQKMRRHAAAGNDDLRQLELSMYRYLARFLLSEEVVIIRRIAGLRPKLGFRLLLLNVTNCLYLPPKVGGSLSARAAAEIDY